MHTPIREHGLIEKVLSEYNMHTFQDWQRWQAPILCPPNTSFIDTALTNVDKGSHFEKSLEI